MTVLAEVGLVQGSRQGRESVWALEPGPLEDARGCLDRIAAECDAALGRLRAFVEEE